MRTLKFILYIVLFLPVLVCAQITFNSVAPGGNWTAGTSWSGGTAPAGASADIITVVAGSTVTVNTNLALSGSGTLTVNGNLTDNTGGTAYPLTLSNFAELHVYNTMTLEGTVNVSNSAVVWVHGCGTLTVGSLTLSNNSILVVDNCATLIVNGNLTLNNNNASTVDGNIQVSGNVQGNNNATVSGAGSIVAGGSITSNNGSSFFGNSGTNCSNTAIPCYAGGGVIGPLPIELLFFEAEATDNKVNLTWATATEENNNYFTIERSEDGFTFSPVANISSAAPNGNSITTLNYSYVDEHPLPAVSYYRLRQTDFDNAYSYSEIIMVNQLPLDKQIRLFPNPATTELSIRFGFKMADEVNTMIHIHDVYGKPVLTKNEIVSGGSLSLSLPDIKTGQYFVTLIVGDHAVHQTFFVSR